LAVDTIGGAWARICPGYRLAPAAEFCLAVQNAVHAALQYQAIIGALIMFRPRAAHRPVSSALPVLSAGPWGGPHGN